MYNSNSCLYIRKKREELQNILKKNTGKQNLAEIQKTVLTSTSNVLRKVLSI